MRGFIVVLDSFGVGLLPTQQLLVTKAQAL